MKYACDRGVKIPLIWVAVRTKEAILGIATVLTYQDIPVDGLSL